MSWKFWLIVFIIFFIIGVCFYFLPVATVKVVGTISKVVLKATFGLVKGIVRGVSKVGSSIKKKSKKKSPRGSYEEDEDEDNSNKNIVNSNVYIVNSKDDISELD